jgi:hypothetical protein
VVENTMKIGKENNGRSTEELVRLTKLSSLELILFSDEYWRGIENKFE